MRSICIIPARGGSKRIPRKNIKSFLGKPIIAYSIEAALNSNLFDEVMVSTDDAEIAEIAMKFGAKVPFFRSADTANDYATTFQVVEEVIQAYHIKGEVFDLACCIYACAPFVNSGRLTDALNLLKEKNFDSVFPIQSFGFPIQRALTQNNEKKIAFRQPEFSLTRSQDLETCFHDAGQFYWINLKQCLALGALVTNNSGAIEITELEGQDIDNEIDWKLAELKYELVQGIK